jgi:hypothetical protein
VVAQRRLHWVHSYWAYMYSRGTRTFCQEQSLNTAVLSCATRMGWFGHRSWLTMTKREWTGGVYCRSVADCNMVGVYCRSWLTAIHLGKGTHRTAQNWTDWDHERQARHKRTGVTTDKLRRRFKRKAIGSRSRGSMIHVMYRAKGGRRPALGFSKQHDYGALW